uniref:Uncharacterized protein n=1 Tax=Ditylenchus dipsaci TaxID=166011 RepID=A0A915DBG3_9BILA
LNSHPRKDGTAKIVYLCAECRKIRDAKEFLRIRQFRRFSTADEESRILPQHWSTQEVFPTLHEEEVSTFEVPARSERRGVQEFALYTSRSRSETSDEGFQENFLIYAIVKLLEDVKAEDLLSPEELLLLEDFELGQLHDYVRDKRARGIPYVSRVANFKPDQLEFDASETVQLGATESSMNSEGGGNDRHLQKESDAVGQRVPVSSIIMPAGWQRYTPKDDRTETTSSSPKPSSFHQEKPLVVSGQQETEVFDVGKGPFSVPTTTSVRGLSKIETANDKLNVDQVDDEQDTEEKMAKILNRNKEPSAEEYETLAKILQQEWKEQRKETLTTAGVHIRCPQEENDMTEIIPNRPKTFRCRKTSLQNSDLPRR